MALPQSLNVGIFGASPYDDPNYRPTYSGSMMGGGENPYTSLINDYVQSDYFDRTPFLDPPRAVAQYSIQDPIFGQVTGGYNPYRTEGFNDYLKQQYQMVQSTDPLRIKRSPEDLAQRDLIRSAYEKMGFGQTSPGIGAGIGIQQPPNDPDATQQLLGPGGYALKPIPSPPTPLPDDVQRIPPTATFSPDSDPYANYNVAEAYKQSDFYDDSMNSQGYLDFLEDARSNFMRRDTQMDMKSKAYGEARGKIFDAYNTFNPITNQAEMDAFVSENPYQLIGSPMSVRKYDDGFFSDPTTPPSVAGEYTPPGTDNPMGMGSDFAKQLLSGMGNLFDKYLSKSDMNNSNEITPPTPPDQMMTADTSSSLPTTLGSKGMYTPGRGY